MAVRSSKRRTEAERNICCNTIKVQFSPAKEPAELCGVPKTTFYDAAVRVETAASQAGTE